MKRSMFVSLGSAALLAAGLNLRAADEAKAPAAAPAPAEAAKPAVTVPDAEAQLAFIPDVVAKYGDKTVSGAELKKMLKPFLSMAAKQGREPSDADLKGIAMQAAQALIDQQLIINQCLADGYKPAAEDAQKQIADAEAQFGGKDKFDAFLKMQGISRDEIVKKIADDAMIKKWVEEKVKPSVTVDDAILKKFYDENLDKFKTAESMSASHILVKVDQGADEAAKAKAKAKAEKLLADLKGGADFAKLAKENSDCPSKDRGGDLGFFEKGMMVPAFEDAAGKLKKDELSGIVETEFGFHIIKGGEQKPAGVRSLDEVKGDLTRYLQGRELQKVMVAKIETMRKDAKVEILLPKPPADTAAPGKDAEAK